MAHCKERQVTFLIFLNTPETVFVTRHFLFKKINISVELQKDTKPKIILQIYYFCLASSFFAFLPRGLFNILIFNFTLNHMGLRYKMLIKLKLLFFSLTPV